MNYTNNEVCPLLTTQEICICKSKESLYLLIIVTQILKIKGKV